MISANWKQLFTLSFYTKILLGEKGISPLVIAAILAFAGTIISSVTIVWKGLPIVVQLPQKVERFIDVAVPDNVEITIKNGIASTNVTEPYYFTIPNTALEEFFRTPKASSSSTVSNARLLAIDTKGSAENFERYQSYALLTQSNIVYYNDRKINIYPLRQIADVTVSKKFIQEKAQTYLKNKWIVPVLIGAVLFVPVFLFLGAISYELLHFFLLAIAVYIMLRLYGLRVGFTRGYRYIAMISLVPGLIWTLLSRAPFVGSYMEAASGLVTLFVLGIAYKGIQEARGSHE